MYVEEQNSHMSVGTPVMCFLLGAAVGATVAILTTPATGTEMRYRIKEKANQVKDKAYDLKNLATEKAEEWKEKAVATTADTLDRASDRVRRAGGSSAAMEPQESGI